MKSLLLLGTLVLAAPMTSFIANDDMAITAPAELCQPMAYTGKVTGWLVYVDGTVAIRLEGTREGERFSLWFATPASRNATTRYETLVLEAVLAVSGPLKDVPVTMITDSRSSGKTVEEALGLISISQR